MAASEPAGLNLPDRHKPTLFFIERVTSRVLEDMFLQRPDQKRFYQLLEFKTCSRTSGCELLFLSVDPFGQSGDVKDTSVSALCIPNSASVFIRIPWLQRSP